MRQAAGIAQTNLRLQPAPEDDPDLDIRISLSRTSRWSRCRRRCACRSSRARSASRIASRGRSGTAISATWRGSVRPRHRREIGLEYRFGLMRGRRSASTGRASRRSSSSRSTPICSRGTRVISSRRVATHRWHQQLQDSYSPALGVVISRTLGEPWRALRRADLGEQHQPAAEGARGRERHLHHRHGRAHSRPADRLCRR